MIERAKKLVAKQWTDKQICIFLYSLSLLMMLVLGLPLSVSYILDETGTVANAAYLAGYNWNDWVNSNGGYFYKYGQAPFYFLLFKIFSNPYLLYKGMMVINGIFVAFIPVVSYKILRKHLEIEDKAHCTLLSLCIVVVPATVLYSLYARGDVMLIVLAWFIIYAVLEAMTVDKKKEQIIWSSMAAFLSVYAYMCHSRGIVFVIATFMVLVAIRFFMKNKNVCFTAYIVNLIIWLLIDDKLTAFFKNNIWGSGNKKNTIENVNYSKYSTVLTEEGIETIVKNLTGWLFNSFLGTFGMVTLGVFFAAVIVFCYVAKKKNITQKELVVNFYSFLIFLGTTMLGILFFYGSNYKFVIGTAVKRADRFLYSRYLSPCYSILVFIALYYLLVKKDCFGWKTKIVTVISSAVLAVYCRTWLGTFVNGIEYSWRNTLDSALFFNTVRYGNDANTYKGVSAALLKMAVFAFVILCIMIVLSALIKKKHWCYVLLGLCMLLSLGDNYKKLRYKTDVRPMLRGGSVITWMDNLEDETNISEEFNDVYVDKSFSRRKMLQLAMPEYVVHVKGSVKAADVDNMFIIATNYKLNENWLNDECYLFADFEWDDTLATVIVKGDELKAALEEKGIELIPIPEDYTERKSADSYPPFEEAIERVFRFQMDSIMN